MSNQLSPEYFLEQDSFKNWVLGQNEADCKYWDNWVKENPDQLSAAVLAAQIYTGISSGPSNVSPEEVKAEWQKLKSRIEGESKSDSTKVIAITWWWKSVAAAIVLMAFSWMGYFLYNPAIENYTTAFSNKKTISLSDGTEIILNANSHLTTKNLWRFAPPREIWLDGEAFFKVKSHPEDDELKQFVVHTKDLDVRVVGTQFNINTRKNGTKVYLNEGKVQLSLKENPGVNTLDMVPGEFVGYSSDAPVKSTVKKVLPSEAVTSWKSGYFSFDHTPLKEVIEIVEATHGIKISVSNPALLEETITGKVPSENINELVKSMTRLFNLSYTMKGSELILQEK